MHVCVHVSVCVCACVCVFELYSVLCFKLYACQRRHACNFEVASCLEAKNFFDVVVCMRAIDGRGIWHEKLFLLL